MQWQSDYIVPFSDLTLNQKEEICNGCGGSESCFKPSHAKLFRPACQPHDYDYAVGGGWLVKVKSDLRLRGRIRLLVASTDIRVLREGLVANDALLPDWAVRQVYYRWADAYFIGVTVGGIGYFRYGPQRWPVMD